MDFLQERHHPKWPLQTIRLEPINFRQGSLPPCQLSMAKHLQRASNWNYKTQIQLPSRLQLQGKIHLLECACTRWGFAYHERNRRSQCCRKKFQRSQECLLGVYFWWASRCSWNLQPFDEFMIFVKHIYLSIQIVFNSIHHKQSSFVTQYHHSVFTFFVTSSPFWGWEGAF